MAAITVTSITDASATDSLPTFTPKVSLRGAASGVYIGPVISVAASSPPTAPTHATGAAAGGVEDSTGYRESDTYDATGGTGGFTGGGEATVITQTRPTGRTAYTADGVQGGSTPGRPISSGNHVYSGGGYGGGGAFDKRSTQAGDGGMHLGARRSTKAVGETVTATDLGRPATGTSANPAAGTVALVDSTGSVDVDLHADDITGGASGYKGAEIALFFRGTDTDTDGALVAHFSADGGTDITLAVDNLATGTYAWYARWRKADANAKVQVGPWSPRATVAVT